MIVSSRIMASLTPDNLFVSGLNATLKQGQGAVLKDRLD